MKNTRLIGRPPAQIFRMLPVLLLAALTGCGIGTQTTTTPGVALSGRIQGGQQPVAGASVLLYAAGSVGNGLGATDLLAPHLVTTDAAGNFSITNDYTCPTPTTQVYLVARGGNPGLASGVLNPALVMLAALGDCSSLSASTFISVNERTTVAAAWALAPFFGSGALAGSSVPNGTGLRNAFGNATALANGTLPANSTTELLKMNSLANALAPCINSDGAAACTPLFSAATAAGVPATNTFDAALNIVRSPGSNVAAIFATAAANAPFQPALSRAPNDWTLSVTYAGGGLNLPGSVAVDSTGSVWAANYLGAAVSKFSPQGVPVAPAGFPGKGLRQSYGIAIDPFDNAWVTNQQSVTAAGNHQFGSISKFTSAGVELSSTGYTGGGIYYPQAAAANASGQLWIANYAGSSATLLATDGSAVSPATGFAASLLPFTSAVALDATGNAWFTDQNGVARLTPSGVVTAFPCCTDPTGIAIDRAGAVWVADYGAYSVVKLSATGQVLAQVSTASAPVSPLALAVDGAGDVWAANYYGNSITAVYGRDASLRSPVAGFGLDAPLNEPYGIAMDASGNLWVSNSGNNTLTVLFGLASPVKTPLLGPPVQP